MEEAVIPDPVMYWGVAFVQSHSTFFSISRYNTSNFPKAPRANEDGAVSGVSQPWWIAERKSKSNFATSDDFLRDCSLSEFETADNNR